MNMKREEIEILAPAGSLETMKAVLAAGADAVYIGGDRFGARAYAQNFGQEELLWALDYAHLHKKKIYLTVNTLLRDEEIDTLYEYLLPFYQNGLDAVIVQDMGVLRLMRQCFPQMPIHASTQMSVCSCEGASMLKKQGVSRIVTARELSLEEIQEIHQKVDIEIESFVHGALCYSYSGQCLFSSILGGRSGNRGRCAQPCRLGYQVVEENNEGNMKNPEQPYVLSLKDINTLPILPDILEAGVQSLKIEGRMKKTEYAAAVVEAYGKYVELYLEKGRDGYKVEWQDAEGLMDIYNRGGFTTGYYKQHNSRNMVSLYKPGHAGVKVSKDIRIKKQEISFTACTRLNPRDILQLESKIVDKKPFQFTVKQAVKKGESCRFLIPAGGKWDIDYGVYRIRNNEKIRQLEIKYKDRQEKIGITGEFYMEEEQPITLLLRNEDTIVSCTGAVAQKAQKISITREEIGKQIGKTGNTPFVLNELQVYGREGLYIGKKELNECRRMGLKLLEEEILKKYRRTLNLSYSDFLGQEKSKYKLLQQEKTEIIGTGQEKLQEDKLWQEMLQKEQSKGTNEGEIAQQQEKLHRQKLQQEKLQKPYIYVIVSNLSQLEAVLESEMASRICIESTMLSDEKCIQAVRQYNAEIHSHIIEWYVAFPYIMRKDTIEKLWGWRKTMTELDVQGCLVRNVDGLAIGKEWGFSNIMSDYSLYTMNRHAKSELFQQGSREWVSCVELNRAQLWHMDKSGMVMGIYGYQPLMISANCVYKTCEGCKKSDAEYILKDRYQEKFFVHRNCDFCYNIIYNSKPLFLLQEWEELQQMGFSSMLMHFTVEDKQEAQRLLCLLKGLSEENTILRIDMDRYTRGHWKRGVE